MTESEAEALLQDKTIFFRCVEDSNDTVMLTDHHGTLFYVNRAWQRVYGYSANEVIGKTPALLRSHQQDQAFYQKMWGEIANPKIGYWKGELVNRSKDGREIPIFLTITPFVDEAKQVRGYMGLGVDISEKKKLEGQLLHQDRLASIGLVASGLAHEIGNPMGVIRGRAEYLMGAAAGNDKVVSGLATIVEQIDKISKLIYSLLHLARGTSDEAVGAVSVAPLLDALRGLLRQPLRKNEIELEISVPPEVVVRAEPIRLEQVFFNLILNASHAIEKAIQGGRKEKHFIRIWAEAKKERWLIHVEDSGTGIRPEDLRNIFQPFFTTKEVGVGTGLGLALSSQVVRSWNGEISVYTTVGKGSRFTLALNAAPSSSHTRSLSDTKSGG